jgi:hypothetical protein
LRYRNVILAFEEIDALDAERLNRFLSSFQNLQVAEPESRAPGFLLIFLVDHGQENDWRHNLLNQAQLTPISTRSIGRDEIRDETLEVAGQLQERLQSIEDVANQIFQDSQGGNPRLVLKQIYKQFKCRIKTHTNRWSQYP